MRILKPSKSSDSQPFTLVEVEASQESSATAPCDALPPTSMQACTSNKNKGQSIEQADISDAKKEFNRLLAKGVHLLSMREHSVKEITDKLSAKSDSLDAVHAVVDELLMSKYLSDERFTESYIRSRRNRGFGPMKIRSELNTKGIKNNMIEDYIDVSSAVWYENAQSQYQKKYKGEAITDYSVWTKRARFMQSRGFSMEHIHSVIPPVESD